MESSPSQHGPRRRLRTSQAIVSTASPDASGAVLAAFTARMGRPPESPEELDRYRRYLLGFVVAVETIVRSPTFDASSDPSSGTAAS